MENIFNINDEIIITIAKLIYLRDLTTIIDGERLIDEPWEDVRDIYINKAKKQNYLMLSEAEVDNMINAATNPLYAKKHAIFKGSLKVDIVDFQRDVDYPIGTLVRYNEKDICVVKKLKEQSTCSECYFYEYCMKINCRGMICYPAGRSDHNDVHFMLIGKYE